MKIAALLPGKDPTLYTPNDVKTLIANISQLALSLAGTLAVIYVVIAAFQYFTAYGNEEKATKAKTTLTWAIIGLAVIVLSKVIITEIWTFISSSKPGFWF